MTPIRVTKFWASTTPPAAVPAPPPPPPAPKDKGRYSIIRNDRGRY